MSAAPKPELSGLQKKLDIHSIKTDVDQMKTSIKEITNSLDIIRRTMADLKSDVADIKEALWYAPGEPGYHQAKTHFEGIGQ